MGKKFHQAQLLLYSRNIHLHQYSKGHHNILYVIINTGEKIHR